MTKSKPLNTDNEKIELSPEQLAPGTTTPESFTITRGDDFTASVSGQREDSPEAAMRSNNRFDRGSNYQDVPANLNKSGERLGSEE